MTTTSVTLTHSSINSGSPVKVLCDKITPTFKINTRASANENSTELVEAQTLSVENPIYSVTGVRYTNESGTLTWSDLITLSKLKYDGTNAIELNVVYGDSVILPSFTGSTSGIDVVITGTPTYPLSTRDTRDAYLPIGAFNLLETK